ncbi:uncharacterized protein [Phyllobates terribilis]|uniref:uncharacterized protein n=1 Tax=Phyllobates terribilis TaxID=111132 RepID=UPI003CCB13D1
MYTCQDGDYMSRVPYASVVGSLMYAMVCPRTNLAFVVSVESRFMVNPEKEHLQAMERIFRYIRDSDYARDVDSRRYLIDYVLTLGGFVVRWKATLHTTIILSITAEEFMALREAAMEGIWIKRLVNGLGQH